MAKVTIAHDWNWRRGCSAPEWPNVCSLGQVGLLLLAFVLFFPSHVAAHPIIVTNAFVYVTRDQISAKVEVFLEDLYRFHQLPLNKQDFLEPDVIRKGIETHKAFLLDKFVIRDIFGERIDGRIVRVKEFDIKPAGVPLAELMAHKLTYEIQYELPAPPEFLTFSQHLVDKDKIVPSVMNLVVKQEKGGVPHTFELKPGEPETLRFDWNNPPLSPEASDEERKKWLESQKAEQLGITDLSTVYAYLYIEDYEVRLEILVPLLSLEESVLIARDEDEFLDVAEQDAARQQIEAFFASGNPLEIDGRNAKPVVRSCDFFGLDVKDFAVRGKRRKVSAISARVGLILAYPLSQPAKEVKLTWNRFNDSIWTIVLVVIDNDSSKRMTLSRLRNRNVYTWTSPGRSLPPAIQEVAVKKSSAAGIAWLLVALLCMLMMLPAIFFLRFRGAPAWSWWATVVALSAAAFYCAHAADRAEPDLDNADSIFAALHQNLFQAFALRDENDIYDALAKCVDGDLRRKIYLSIRQRLQMEDQGGAVSRVEQVEIVDGKLTKTFTDPQGLGFNYECTWTVTGTVEHWGHVHSRTNQYQAIFSIAPRDDAWKITDMKLVKEERVMRKTNVR
ncbi:MAG: hypothetical protein KatS3mg105_0139 [Gemmatales bacterium]|nr:MAG: hypothetical protein KatS3mg105_0139 [Gemmatales bacterium]